MATKLKISKEMFTNTRPVYYVELVVDNFYHHAFARCWNLKRARQILKNYRKQKYSLI